MSTEIKPGQTWADKNGDRLRVDLVRPAHIEFKWEVGIMAILTTAEFLSAYELVDTTPAPLDPSKVKAGDTVTLESVLDEPFEVTGVVEKINVTQTDSSGKAVAFNVMIWARWFTVGLNLRLTAHQPAPEPEPEWEPGTVAEATVKGRFGRVRVMRLHETPTDKTHHWVEESGTIPDDSHVTNIRPLVVLDPTTTRKAVVDALAENLSDDVNYEGLSKTTDAVVAALGIRVGGAR